MPSVMDLLLMVNDIPMPVKVAWLVWMLWCGVQVVWYRRARVEELTAPPPTSRTSSGRRPAAVASKPPSVSRIGGTPAFLAELGLHDPNVDDSTASHRSGTDLTYK